MTPFTAPPEFLVSTNDWVPFLAEMWDSPASSPSNMLVDRDFLYSSHVFALAARKRLDSHVSALKEGREQTRGKFVTSTHHSLADAVFEASRLRFILKKSHSKIRVKHRTENQERE